MNIEYEILHLIYLSDGELDYHHIEAYLTDYNFHSEVHILEKILDDMKKGGLLTVNIFFGDPLYKITALGEEYMRSVGRFAEPE
ncbi:MAG: hypothetical protein QM762_28425 [Chryseolinea sp.]